MEYASLLLQAGKKDEALQGLDEGVRHSYPDMPELIPFYSLTARLRREAGRVEEAQVLEAAVRRLQNMNASSYHQLAY
jgi:hypothetical protein